MEDELKNYLELPQIKLKSETDLRDWWREHAAEFPNVEVMARAVLRLPRVVRCGRTLVLASSK